MKRRVNNSEIELAKKSSKILFLISFLLLIMLFAGFGILYYLKVDVLSYLPSSKPKEVIGVQQEEVRKNDTKKATKEMVTIPLDKDDANIQKLFKIVKVTNKLSCEEDGYGVKDRVVVNGLTTKCKFSLASMVYKDSVKQSLEGKLYVKEEDVKAAYNNLFGADTYVKQESIPCLYKTNFMYNGDYYFTEKVTPEEASSMTSYEKIISASREGERLDITTAVLYYESVLAVFCYDSRCDHVIENLKKGVEYGEEYLSLYVDYNESKLYQYTYHFEMDTAGFYRFIGYDRKTNEN